MSHNCSVTPVSSRPLSPHLTTIIPLGIYFSQCLTGIFLVLSQVLNRVEKSLPLTLMQSNDWLVFPTRKHIWLVLNLSIKLPAIPSLHQDEFLRESRKLYHLEYSLLWQAQVEWVVSTHVNVQVWPVDLNPVPPKERNSCVLLCAIKKSLKKLFILLPLQIPSIYSFKCFYAGGKTSKHHYHVSKRQWSAFSSLLLRNWVNFILYKFCLWELLFKSYLLLNKTWFTEGDMVRRDGREILAFHWKF